MTVRVRPTFAKDESIESKEDLITFYPKKKRNDWCGPGSNWAGLGSIIGDTKHTAQKQDKESQPTRLRRHHNGLLNLLQNLHLLL
jgi:hypothetical protein